MGQEVFSRVLVSNVQPTRLLVGNEDRKVDIVVLNTSASIVEIFDRAHAAAGEGFPLAPGGEYRATAKGSLKLWGLSLGSNEVVVAVSRTVVERVAIVWEFKGPVEDMIIARLPFPEAQDQLRGAVESKSRTLASCEWHGANSNLGDPERTSFAMVNENGPLTGLVGERIAVSFGARQVFAYVHRSAALDSDLSVTRRLFMALAPLSTTSLDVTVGVVL
jgi:hypothetical protein